MFTYIISRSKMKRMVFLRLTNLEKNNDNDKEEKMF